MLALLLLVTLTGCLGVESVLSPAPDVTVENRANVSFEVTATTVHTDGPVGETRLELTHQNGSKEELAFREYAVGNDFAVPPNVTGIEVIESSSTSWVTELDPGETTSTELGDWQSNDLVLVTWTRLDTGTVTKVTTIPCRTSGVEYHGHVSSARGSGGAFTGC
ncbi:hypothetical protein HUG10_02625 [Halorarum halophilum]|uniref:Uncharacterized protein n=1 Tax=Halorarum halophilum TaxID=2743090 RepID=A0A7D5K049_9EURY|nr:hypothetical protein [Halobaculum halophilum]QLG26501.1 hypothetical protein HUG10_02625 [Halobaculum halophilum]